MLSKTSRLFSTLQTKVAVIGAGAGGHTFSAQLLRSGGVKHGDITVFDPSTEHYYQPAFTLIGGGVIGDAV
jgi:sulfide:quinone oxidoreductase